MICIYIGFMYINIINYYITDIQNQCQSNAVLKVFYMCMALNTE